jgi:hypothetical protein
MPRRAWAIAAAAAALVTAAPAAHAFCGFYVSGSGAKASSATAHVVLMRQGTKTVVSMQSDYDGPLEDFALVVPVPVVLQQADVKTLARDVLARVDALGAPRLVEYWEQDPCPAPVKDRGSEAAVAPRSAPPAPVPVIANGRPAVKIEAAFEVGEYSISILSATEAAGLEAWLKQNRYQLPAGAEPLLRPYVDAGGKFFVAKVDPTKVAVVGGRAALSPLRFHYDSEDFSLPIRLGLANASGAQDLIVNILSEDKRYEVANYKNVFIPTNLDVRPAVKARFSAFYAALLERTLEANPGAVVTEYAWTATPFAKCDPCPDSLPAESDLLTLGGDVIGGKIASGSYVLTRLHARFGRADPRTDAKADARTVVNADLRFKEARPVVGGREVWRPGGLEQGAMASPDGKSYFQARYAIRHSWTGPLRCKNPHRAVWGGAPDGGGPGPIAASQLALAPRGKIALGENALGESALGEIALGEMVKRDLPEIGVKQVAPAVSPPPAGATRSLRPR